jgi:hypothetical protein
MPKKRKDETDLDYAYRVKETLGWTPRLGMATLTMSIFFPLSDQRVFFSSRQVERAGHSYLSKMQNSSERRI